MNKLLVISNIAKTLAKTGENIELMVGNTAGTADEPEISELYYQLILDELSHIQLLVLQLTKMLTGDETEPEKGDSETAADKDAVEKE